MCIIVTVPVLQVLGPQFVVGKEEWKIICACVTITYK